MDKISFVKAGCGHVITPFNLGGVCSICGKLCCKDCLVTINDDNLCPSCLKKMIKG